METISGTIRTMQATGQLANTTPDPMQASPPPEVGNGRFVFGRMLSIYGNTWVDRWRTGELDDNGKDRGVSFTIAAWDKALAKFPREVVAVACRRCNDERFRVDYRICPSLGEVEAQCRAAMPRKPPPLSLQDRSRDTLQAEGRERAGAILAGLRRSAAANPVNRLESLVCEAYTLAGGDLHDLAKRGAIVDRVRPC